MKFEGLKKKKLSYKIDKQLSCSTRQTSNEEIRKGGGRSRGGEVRNHKPQQIGASLKKTKGGRRQEELRGYQWKGQRSHGKRGDVLAEVESVLI